MGGIFSKPKTVVAQPTAQPAAPAGDSAQRAGQEESAVKKKKRGKRSLMVDPAGGATGGGNTGLNV